MVVSLSMGVASILDHHQMKTGFSNTEFKAPPGVIVRHTPRGWTNEQMMRAYLEWLSTQVNDGSILLVLDVYSARQTFSLMQRARELGIELLFVPAGGTSRFQSLDRRVFGNLKLRARHAFERFGWQTGEPGSTTQQDAAVLVEASRAISEGSIRTGWKIEQTACTPLRQIDP
jgi:hypothetical protein